MNRKCVTQIFLLIFALLALGAGGSNAQDLQPGPNIAGNWTIYAYNIDRPGSSLKTIQVIQNGNIISGTFKGPNQHGKFQGWINGKHIEFSTDTREILTFRGEISPQGMSGLYGIHGRHAPWHAERTNQ
jgi:hypothetical protein